MADLNVNPERQGAKDALVEEIREIHAANLSAALDRVGHAPVVADLVALAEVVRDGHLLPAARSGRCRAIRALTRWFKVRPGFMQGRSSIVTGVPRVLPEDSTRHINRFKETIAMNAQDLAPVKTRARFAPALLAMALVGGLAAVTAGPAQAGPAAATYYLKFDKSSVTNSSLALMKSVAGPDKVVKKYRAGSGVTTNECARSKGWLPTKSYTIQKWHKTYNASLIKGYAFQLNDTKCKDGRTSRTELFIHSEMTKNGGRGRTEATRWDGNGDYKSAGCIKLKPADIKDLYQRGRAVGFPKKLVVTN